MTAKQFFKWFAVVVVGIGFVLYHARADERVKTVETTQATQVENTRRLKELVSEQKARQDRHELKAMLDAIVECVEDGGTAKDCRKEHSE